jgi:hypothetical protein
MRVDFTSENHRGFFATRNDMRCSPIIAREISKEEQKEIKK